MSRALSAASYASSIHRPSVTSRIPIDINSSSTHVITYNQHHWSTLANQKPATTMPAQLTDWPIGCTTNSRLAQHTNHTNHQSSCSKQHPPRPQHYICRQSFLSTNQTNHEQSRRYTCRGRRASTPQNGQPASITQEGTGCAVRWLVRCGYRIRSTERKLNCRGVAQVTPNGAPRLTRNIHRCDSS